VSRTPEEYRALTLSSFLRHEKYIGELLNYDFAKAYILEWQVYPA